MLRPIVRPDSTQRLPAELVTQVLDDLESEDIVAVSQTCRRLRTISSAHNRFWHSCEMRDSISDKSNLKTRRRRFIMRVLNLVALGLPIGIVLWFRYDTESVGGIEIEIEIDGDAEGDGEGRPCDDLFGDDIPVSSDNAGLVRFALSAPIAPSVVSFDLGLANMSAALAYTELSRANMPALRHLCLRIAVEFENWRFDGTQTQLAPIPGGILSGSAPKLCNVMLMGVSFAVTVAVSLALAVGSACSTTSVIPAFANVTTASLFDIDLGHMHNLALYLPNVVRLTLGPTLMHDVDEESGATMSMFMSPTYLHGKLITPFGTSLKTLHLDCIDFDHGFYVVDGCESDQRYPILVQIVRGLAPHLHTISVSGLSYANVDDDEVVPIDDLVGAFGPGDVDESSAVTIKPSMPSMTLRSGRSAPVSRLRPVDYNLI